VFVVGRYAVYGEIASGGMATVHFGRLMGASGFARTVAIKRLHPQFAREPEFVGMFLDEARLAARIRHPNVVPTLDVIATDGELFIVMEYVQGETLSRLLRALRERGEAMPPRIAASVLSGVAHGLHAAHEATDEKGAPLGIVHRDVSPQNVILGVDGVARVLDFGVAKAAVRLQTTRDGQLKGKLAYMAPEQLGSGVVNRLTDIYATGVLLWEALTGRRLFEAESEGELVAKVLLGQPPAPSTVNPAIPPEMDAIAMRALDLEPANRFQSAREMALALEGVPSISMHSQVGEWVATVAHDVLAFRAQRIADIETSAQVRGPTTVEDRAVLPIRSEDPTVAAPPGFLVDTGSAPGRLDTGGTPVSSAALKRARRHILVIDDSEVMLSRIRAALEGDGYDVITTSRAVGTARHIPTCDLAIIDYHMPGIDGGTVITSLRAAAQSSKAAAKGAQTCLFYLYTSDPAIAKDHARLGFDGCLVDKGDELALVRQVRAVFRMLQMRALQQKR
jgi:serine/threonine protein kinase/CheY-like chemotaxis protein